MPMEPRQGPVWQPGQEVVALYNFHGNSPEDLPFSKTDVLTIVKSTKDPNWYRARSKQNKDGMIPANYVCDVNQAKNMQSRNQIDHLARQPDRIQGLYPFPVSPLDDGHPSGQQSGYLPGQVSVFAGAHGHNTNPHGGSPADHRGSKSRDQPSDERQGNRVSANQSNKAASQEKGGKQEVPLQMMPWFHGKISRQTAEDLLVPREDGLFLLRESNNFPGDYTLCVCHQKKVEHYHVHFRNNQLTIDDEVYFENLTELVEHYERDADGLCTKLYRPKHSKESYTSVSTQQFQDGGWNINQEDLVIGELIGKGEFADVYKGTYHDKAVAIKQLKDNNRQAQSFLKEASLMTSLRHPNLVSLIGVVLGNNINLVTEFMGRGNLVDYLRARGRQVLTKKDLINFATDTCAAMVFLEEKGVVHRDLAARNVLVHDDCTAKVSDFGLAKYEDYTLDSGKFPIKWTSPEALRQLKFTSKSDMWSFGVLLWEIYSFGRIPYPRIPLTEVVIHVEKGYRMECPESCPQEIYNIMLQSWNIEATDRPLFKTVLDKLQSFQAVLV